MSIKSASSRRRVVLLRVRIAGILGIYDNEQNLGHETLLSQLKGLS
jgi:hypothetical protein